MRGAHTRRQENLNDSHAVLCAMRFQVFQSARKVPTLNTDFTVAILDSDADSISRYDDAGCRLVASPMA
jgi:hypothetical protein